MNLFEVEVEQKSGLLTTLEEHKGKVLLIVNTASKCGFTPQLAGLQDLYETYKSKGLEILAFPCGQFLNQELENNTKIAEFCQLNYGVSFPLYAKTFVKGKNQAPLYDYLTTNSPVRANKKVKWNFEKFLINKDGEIVNRYLPKVKPEALVNDIEELLKEI